MCPKCNSTSIGEDPHGERVYLTCFDCGYEWVSD